ncbi:MAG: ferrous iron transporter B, partial [Thermodesulfovibrio sp.]|nr:ferrous iron transporter B [Thermodesulfovibrio sp.]
LSPIFEPLGFGTWQTSSSLVAGLIAKEVVVSTMAQIYVGEDEAKEVSKEEMNLLRDIKEILFSFLSALKEAFENIISGFGIKSLSTEEEEKQSPLKSKLQGIFTPLSAYAFLAFVLLYWPCVVVGIAMKQEFGSWKIYGQTLIIHSILAWLVSFIIYQGGSLLGF